MGSTEQKPCWRLQWQQEKSEGPGVCVLLWWSLINSVSCPSAFPLICCPSALIVAFIYANPKAHILKECLSTPADAKHNSWILMQLGITTIWGLFSP